MDSPWESPSASHFGEENGRNGGGRGTYPLASFSQRLMAWLIDIVILATIGEVLLRINPKEANGVTALVDLGYMVLLLGGPFGQTIGAKIAKVRVVNLDGKPLGYWRATARYLISGISALILGLGYLWMLKDPKKQTLHDKIAGSLVISLAHHNGLEPIDTDASNRPFNL